MAWILLASSDFELRISGSKKVVLCDSVVVKSRSSFIPAHLEIHHLHCWNLALQLNQRQFIQGSCGTWRSLVSRDQVSSHHQNIALAWHWPVLSLAGEWTRASFPSIIPLSSLWGSTSFHENYLCATGQNQSVFVGFVWTLHPDSQVGRMDDAVLVSLMTGTERNILLLLQGCLPSDAPYHVGM